MNQSKVDQCRELGVIFKVLVEDDTEIREGVKNLLKAINDEYSHFPLIYVVARAYLEGYWDGKLDNRERLKKMRRRLKSEYQC